MGGESTRPTLAEYLAGEELGRLVEKRLLRRGYNVGLAPFLITGLSVFQKAALLGRARRDRLEILAEMFVGLDALAGTRAQLGLPSQAARGRQWVVEYLRKVASDGMRYYGEEPESFLDLWLTSFAPPEVDFRDPEKMRHLAKKRIRLGMALDWLDRWVLVGISFGATFPDLTEGLWRESYEEIDLRSWAEAREYGLDIPEQPTPLPLEDMEQQVLLEVAAYAMEYFPELVTPLGLRVPWRC